MLREGANDQEKLNTDLSGLAEVDPYDPLRSEHLSSSYTTAWNRVKHGIENVSATCLGFSQPTVVIKSIEVNILFAMIQ